jgi:hypothetical protein
VFLLRKNRECELQQDRLLYMCLSLEVMHMALEERERQLSGTTSQGLSQEELPLRLSS